MRILLLFGVLSVFISSVCLGSQILREQEFECGKIIALSSGPSLTPLIAAKVKLEYTKVNFGDSIVQFAAKASDGELLRTAYTTNSTICYRGVISAAGTLIAGAFTIGRDLRTAKGWAW